MAETLEQLAESLALGEGFQLGLLIVPDLQGADASLGALQRLLGARLGRPALLSRVSPAPDLVEEEALCAAALDPLVGLPPSDGVILDASGATAGTEPAWAEVFRRLNARRNGFARQLGRALVLCLTPRLEVVLAREAPDLWSVRGPRAEVGAPESSVRRTAEGVRFEDAVAAGLPEGLQRIFPDTRAALPMLAELGYAPARLPLSDAEDFWPQVLRGLDQGRFPGGIDTLIRRVALEYGEEPSVRRSVGLLPQRVWVDSGWVRPLMWSLLKEEARSALVVERPWMQEVREFLRGAPGRRLGIFGERGSGRMTGWERALSDVERDRPWVMACDWEARLNNSRFWTSLSARPEFLGTAWGRIAKALKIGERPDEVALQTLPSAVQRFFPSDILAEVPPAFEFGFANEVIHKLMLPVHMVGIRRATLEDDLEEVIHFLEQGFPVIEGQRKFVLSTRRWTSCGIIAPPSWLPRLRDYLDVVVEVPSIPASGLLQILARRQQRTRPQHSLVLGQPAFQHAIRALATLAATPEAFLLWTERLLKRWPMPPPAEWTRREHLAALVADPSDAPLLLSLGALVDEGVVAPSAILERVGKDIRPLLETGLSRPPILERDPTNPELLRLSPEAALLRPSVAEALAAAAREP